MGLFNKLFKKKKKKKTIKELVKELIVGDIVQVEFKTPDEIGIVNGSETVLVRINQKEMEAKKITGTISTIRDLGSPVKTKIIEISTYSSPSMPGKERRITFLEDEIKSLRKIND